METVLNCAQKSKHNFLNPCEIFLFLAQVFLQVPTASFLPSHPSYPSNLANIPSHQVPDSACASTQQKKWEAKVCREPPEKALQGIITGYAVDPGSISPHTSAANQNVYPTKTRAEKRETSFCLQENKMFSLSLHGEGLFYPQVQNRKKSSGK